MNVVQINAVYHSSSTGRLTEELHNFLLDKGVNSYVFCTNIKGAKDNIYKIGNKLDYMLHASLSHLLGKQAYFSFISTSFMIKKLDRIQPDVIILGNLHGNFINLPLLLKYIANKNIPTILILHDCWFFTGHCCYYTDDNCYKWKVQCNKCPILHKYNKSLFLDNSKSIFDHKKQLFSQVKQLTVVGVSDWIKNEAMQSPILHNASNFLRIYNWIDLDLFKPLYTDTIRTDLSIGLDTFLILGVSQYWSEYKGLNRFIRLAKDNESYKIILVGEMPANVELPSNILSVGAVNSAEILAKYYNAADVFVNFSIQETFGLVSAEAIACGTPLITNSYTANPEICGRSCGYIVELDHWSTVIDAIEDVRIKGKKYFLNSCRNFAVNNFSKRNSLESYSNTIKYCVSSQKMAMD